MQGSVGTGDMASTPLVPSSQLVTMRYNPCNILATQTSPNSSTVEPQGLVACDAFLQEDHTASQVKNGPETHGKKAWNLSRET